LARNQVQLALEGPDPNAEEMTKFGSHPGAAPRQSS
jgi:hypothetical protein